MLAFQWFFFSLGLVWSCQLQLVWAADHQGQSRNASCGLASSSAEMLDAGSQSTASGDDREIRLTNLLLMQGNTVAQTRCCWPNTAGLIGKTLHTTSPIQLPSWGLHKLNPFTQKSDRASARDAAYTHAVNWERGWNRTEKKPSNTGSSRLQDQGNLL